MPIVCRCCVGMRLASRVGDGHGARAVVVPVRGGEREAGYMATATIRVGAASWTDHEPFYPPEYEKASMKSQRISFYAQYFSMVEVDSTFYHLQPARNFQMWADRTPDDFVFDVKAYGELTWHHRDDNGTPITPSADTFA